MRKRGEIKAISEILEVYKNRVVCGETIVVKETIEVVSDLLNVCLKESEIKYNTSNRLLIVLNGVLKSEMRLHKESILQHLKGRLGANNCPVDLI